MPSWEARFEKEVWRGKLPPPTLRANSYGFRPGRSVHDAISQSWNRLNGQTKDTWILEADIKGCFDNISHEYILKTIGQVPGRELIKQWLKAGYVEGEMFHETESGTPQGGIISPLLKEVCAQELPPATLRANIALDGLDILLSQYKKVKIYQTTRKKTGKVEKVKIRSEKYGFIRYADDFI